MRSVVDRNVVMRRMTVVGGVSWFVLYTGCHYGRLRKRTRWAENVACMGEKINLYRILVWKPEEKKTLRRHGCRWENNIKLDLKVIELEDLNWWSRVRDKAQWRAVVRQRTFGFHKIVAISWQAERLLGCDMA